jgi:hypothetical protein
MRSFRSRRKYGTRRTKKGGGLTTMLLGFGNVHRIKHHKPKSIVERFKNYSGLKWTKSKRKAKIIKREDKDTDSEENTSTPKEKYSTHNPRNFYL